MNRFFNYLVSALVLSTFSFSVSHADCPENWLNNLHDEYKEIESNKIPISSKITDKDFGFIYGVQTDRTFDINKYAELTKRFGELQVEIGIMSAKYTSDAQKVDVSADSAKYNQWKDEFNAILTKEITGGPEALGAAYKKYGERANAKDSTPVNQLTFIALNFYLVKNAALLKIQIDTKAVANNITPALALQNLGEKMSELTSESFPKLEEKATDLEIANTANELSKNLGAWSECTRSPKPPMTTL